MKNWKPLREYKVRASSMTASYNAGRYIAGSAAEACEMARNEYRNSSLGRDFKDAGRFRFYVVDKFDFEEEEE